MEIPPGVPSGELNELLQGILPELLYENSFRIFLEFPLEVYPKFRFEDFSSISFHRFLQQFSLGEFFLEICLKILQTELLWKSPQ